MEKHVSSEEIRKIEEIFSKIPCEKRILIVPERDVIETEPRNIEIIDVKDIVKITEKRM